jgi:hypothetical protein
MYLQIMSALQAAPTTSMIAVQQVLASTAAPWVWSSQQPTHVHCHDKGLSLGVNIHA